MNVTMPRDRDAEPTLLSDFQFLERARQSGLLIRRDDVTYVTRGLSELVDRPL